MSTKTTKGQAIYDLVHSWTDRVDEEKIEDKVHKWIERKVSSGIPKTKPRESE